MAHFCQPEVANSAPPAGQSAYRPGRTIHRFLQLWCFRQFNKEILPLPSGKAVADLALIHQPALIHLTRQKRAYGLFAQGNPWSDFAVRARPTDTPPVPESLDWDLWLGPVPYRPYHPEYHPLKWRAWLDFGTGALGDMGCHIIDPAFWALDLGAPESIQATTTHWQQEVSSETFPRASIVRYEFPARGNRPPVKLTWYDGRLLPPIPDELEKDRKIPGSGAFIIGDKGCILHGSHGAGGLRIVPETKMREYKSPEKTIPRVNNH